MKTNKHSKRFNETAKLIDKQKTYSIEEGVDLIKKTANTKFDSSVEVHFKLGINTKKSDQSVRGNVILPNGTGKTKKVAVITGADKQKEAKDVGADIVGGDDMIEEIKQTAKTDFDILLATPDMMRKLAPIAKILGTRGLMPSPKNDTVVTNISKSIEEIKKGKTSFKNDDTGNVHDMVGKVSFDGKKLVENIKFFIESVEKAKPAGVKGAYIKNIFLSSAMGPSVKISK
ncbi:MAG: 50S ribosomal protein L1 [bacterium]